MQNKYTKLKAQLLDIVEAAEEGFNMADEDDVADVADASAEYAYVLEQITTAYVDAGFDVRSIVAAAL